MLNYDIDTGADILEESLSDAEAARIKGLILKKVGRKQRSRGRKLAAVLVACCLMLTGVAAYALTGLNIFDAFRAVFGEKASYLSNILPIEEGASGSGLTVTVRGAAGYGRNAFIMVELAREDGIQFIGDNLELKDYTLEVEGVSNLSVSTSNASVMDGKALITFNVQSPDGLAGEKASVKIGGLDYRELKLEKASLDISGIPGSRQADAENLIENNTETAVYVWKYEPRSIRRPFFPAYVRNKAMIPEKIAASQNLDLPMLKDKSWLLLDTVCFAEGKLHVRVINTAGDEYGQTLLYMMDPQTGDIAPMLFWPDQSASGDAMYYVYDISDVPQLNRYELMVEYYGEKEIFTGDWKVEFDLGIDAEEPDFRPSVDMQEYGDSFTVEEIHVTPTAAYIRFSPRDGQKIKAGLSLAADIRMKDGSYVKYNSGDVTAINQEYLDYNCYYDPIDINEIDTIIVKSWEQLISDQTDRLLGETFKVID